jgi:hypothetical protein
MIKGKFIALLNALHDAGFTLISFTPDTKKAMYADAHTGIVRDVTQLFETATLQIAPIDLSDQKSRS